MKNFYNCSGNAMKFHNLFFKILAKLVKQFLKKFHTFQKVIVSWVVPPNMSKDFDRVWWTSLPHKPKSYEASDPIFEFIPSFCSNTSLQIVLEMTSLKGYPVNIGVHQGSALGPTLFLLYVTRGISKLFLFNAVAYCVT